MLDFLRENAQWIFSGIGVFLLSGLVLIVRGLGSQVVREAFYFRGHDVFISSPMLAFKDDAAFQAHDLLIRKVLEVLREASGFRKIFYFGNRITTVEDKGFPDTQVRRNLQDLRRSRRYLGIFPSSVSTGAHVEAGFALGLKKPSIYFVAEDAELPSVLAKAATILPYVRLYRYSDPDDMLTQLRRQGVNLFSPAKDAA